MGYNCFVPKCNTGNKSCRNKLSLFQAPKDEVLLSKWRQAIARPDRELSERDHVCELHFEPHFIKREWIHEHNGKIVQRVRYIRPKLDKSAIPTLFPGSPGYLSKSTSKPAARQPPRLLTAVIPRKCLAANNNNEMENRPIECGMEIEEPEDNDNVGECANNSSADVDKTLTYAMVLHSLAWQQLQLPTMAWGTHELNHLGLKTICISELIETSDQRLDSLKKICVDETMHCKVYIHGVSVELGAFDVNNAPQTLDELQVLIDNVHSKVLCRGGPGGVEHEGIRPQAAYVDMGGVWRHKQCKLFVETNRSKRCSVCRGLNNLLTIHAKRQQRRRECQHVRMANLRRASRLKTKAVHRLSSRLKVISEKLQDVEQKMAIIEDQTLQENLGTLNLPPAQLMLINECIAAGKLASKNGIRYTDEWLLVCLQLYRRSRSMYIYLRKHEIMPLPCTETISRYLGLDLGFDKAIAVALGKKLSKKSELESTNLPSSDGPPDGSTSPPMQ